MLDIKIIKTDCPKEKPAKGQKLGFGKIFTDHMFVMNYTEGKGWHDPRVVLSTISACLPPSWSIITVRKCSRV